MFDFQPPTTVITKHKEYTHAFTLSYLFVYQERFTIISLDTTLTPRS